MPRQKILDIGAGPNVDNKNVDTLDRMASFNPDITHDVTELPLPIDGETYDLILLDNVLEHLPNEAEYIEDLFQEFERILKEGGEVKIKVPYYQDAGAAGDLTHTSNGYSYQIHTKYLETSLEPVQKKLIFPHRKMVPHGLVLEKIANRFPGFYELYLNTLPGFSAREVEVILR